MNDDDSTQAFTVLSSGTEVNQYRIIEKIGAGGMGEVYLAEDSRLDRKVALKFLPLQFCQSEDSRARFIREAKAVAKLDHPNIVQIFEVGEFQGRPFFAMAHIEGSSLRELIKQGGISASDAIELVKQLCDGLQEAHGAGIIHRDIKPANIIIDNKGKPRLLDFGLATVAGERKLTQTGSTMGTVAYMSPEQIEGKEVDRRSDLFSVGVIFYEMLTGRRPFEGSSDTAIARSITDVKPEPVARYKAGISEALQQIVDKSLSKDPSHRYQHAEGMIADLKRLNQSETKRRGDWWNRYVVTGAVFVLIIVFLIAKPWKFQISLDHEAVAQENKLAIMYFDNLADPTDSLRFGEIATNLLITNLSGSEYIDVVSSQHLYDILKSLGHEGEKKIDRSLATEIAKKSRSKLMLLGSILQTEPVMVITSQLVDVASGSAIASQRIDGSENENIFPIVDSLSVEIKKDLSLPAGASGEKGLGNAGFTESTEAYKLYLEGWEEAYKFNGDAAAKKFQEAIRIDSSFTTAYFGLSFTASDHATQYAAISRALEHIEDVSEVDRHAFLARKAQLDGDREGAIEELNEILEKQPDSKDAWNWMGILYKSTDSEKALECFHKAIEIDPLYKPAYNEMAYLYDQLGDLDKSIWAINKYIETAPDDANPYDTRGDLYALNGHLDKAIESYEKALTIDPDFATSLGKLPGLYVLNRQYDKAEKLFRALISNPDKNTRARGRRLLARIPTHQGRFNEAIRILDVGIEADKMELGVGLQVAEKLWIRGMINGVHLRNYDVAISDLKKAIAIRSSIDPKDNFIPHLMANMARFYAAKGDYEMADKEVQSTKSRIKQNGSSNYRNYDLARAFVALEKGDFAAFSAIWKVHAASSFGSDYLMAVSYYGAGRIADAVHLLEQTMKRYGGGRANWPATSVKTHYLLAKCYEASGWKDKAIEQYDLFLDIWKNADDGIKEVEDAKARVSKLKQSA